MSPVSSGRSTSSYPWWQILTFAVVAAAFLYLTGQLTAPFLAHDDWPFLLPASQQGGQALPWANTLLEGRWIDYLWYQVSMHLTAEAGNILYTVAYLATTCVLAALVSNKRLFLLCALALFFSPMFSELSLWPDAMFSGTALCGIAVFALLRLEERFAPLVLFVATFALVMAYPPLASIVLLAATARQARPTVRSNIILAVVFLIAFAVSVLSAYGLNALFHGYFGVKVALWRHPHPLRSAADLGVNLRIAAANWHGLARLYWVPIACIAIASVLALSWKQTRPRGLSLVFALVICWCVTAGITVIAGVGNPGRSLVWLWVAACFVCVLVAGQYVRFYRYAGIALLLVLIGFGGTFAWRNYRSHRLTVAYVSLLGHVVRKYPDIGGHPPTIALGGDLSREPAVRALADGGWPSLKWIMRKQYGVKLQHCDYAACAGARKYLLLRNIRHPLLLWIDGQPVLALNHYRVDRILRNYPSAAQEVRLHLNYPAFLQFAPDIVRIVPFYPGSSKVPVSIALPDRKSGYTLRNQGVSCEYPVDYWVMSNKGAPLMTGQYRSPGSITFDRSNGNGDFTLLSVRMANGAKNNYDCNIVVAANP